MWQMERPQIRKSPGAEEIMVLSRDCDACELQRRCQVRYGRVVKGEFVFCPNGERKLVDT